MFILPNSAGQAAVACVLAVLTVGVFALVNPYSDANDHRAYTLGALTIFLTMFMGLVVRVRGLTRTSQLYCCGVFRLTDPAARCALCLYRFLAYVHHIVRFFLPRLRLRVVDP